MYEKKRVILPLNRKVGIQSPTFLFRGKITVFFPYKKRFRFFFVPRAGTNETFHDDNHAPRSNIILIFGNMIEDTLLYPKVKV